MSRIRHFCGLDIMVIQTGVIGDRSLYCTFSAVRKRMSQNSERLWQKKKIVREEEAELVEWMPGVGNHKSWEHPGEEE